MDSDRDLVLSWFRSDELDDCPKCGAHTVVTTPMTRVCLDCGVLEIQLPIAE